MARDLGIRACSMKETVAEVTESAAAAQRRTALGRLFVYRVVVAAPVAPDECRDLSPENDRRPADQFPCAGDPDQEADDHQDCDGVHCAGVVWLGDHADSLDQL